MSVISKKFGKDLYEVLYLVDEEHHGMRLDQFMQIYLSSFSREQVKEKIKLGEVKIIGRPGKNRPNTKVHWKDQVQMIIPQTEHEDEWWRGEKLTLETTPDIIFEDDDLLVINKPPYMATHPTGKHLFNCATVFFEADRGQTTHSIHRLDRETSGVLLLGKHPKAAQVFTQCFEEELVKKCYFFIAVENDEYQGQVDFESNERLGTTETGLKRVYINNYPANSERGKRAHTKFKILHRENGYALGLAFPQTGRQHQIRVHALVRGLPLLGDKLYLGSFEMFQRFKDCLASDSDHDLMEISRHALHAIALNLPKEGKRATFISHLPSDLVEWIKAKLTIKIPNLEQDLQKEIENYFKTLDK